MGMACLLSRQVAGLRRATIWLDFIDGLALIAPISTVRMKAANLHRQ
jgi:hypothetical protein